MKEKQQPPVDPHLDAPSESNSEKHINFREAEEQSAVDFMINKDTSERQQQWQQEIEQGEEKKRNSDDNAGNLSMPMDNDDTLGIP